MQKFLFLAFICFGMMGISICEVQSVQCQNITLNDLGGPWKEKCQDAEVRSCFLKATCRKDDGGVNVSSLRVNIGEDLKNIVSCNGTLKFGGC